MKLSHLHRTDPEFTQRWEAFADHEVVNETDAKLDETTRYLAILAALIACQGVEVYREMLKEALDEERLTPTQIKEIVYQAVAYLGIAKVFPFLIVTNEVMTENGIRFPLKEQSATTMENRLLKGADVQVAIFGEMMRDFWKGGHINRWLASNCFGDYYTRKGLNLRQREMITFCFLAAQGGCESQLFAHVNGNHNLGNDEAFLTKVISQCLPYIGYPRSLNALACIRQATQERMKQNK